MQEWFETMDSCSRGPPPLLLSSFCLQPDRTVVKSTGEITDLLTCTQYGRKSLVVKVSGCLHPYSCAWNHRLCPTRWLASSSKSALLAPRRENESAFYLLSLDDWEKGNRYSRRACACGGSRVANIEILLVSKKKSTVVFLHLHISALRRNNKA